MRKCASTARRSCLYNTDMIVIDKALARAFLPGRSDFSHKGDFGRVLMFCGSKGMSGAAALAALAALRSGCGLVAVASGESAVSDIAAHIKEATFIPLKEENGSVLRAEADFSHPSIAGANTALIGCGLGALPSVPLFMRRLIELDLPTVIDADGINVLAGNIDSISGKNILLTPHPLEFSRISGLSPRAIERDRAKHALAFAAKRRVFLLLKGANTLIALPDGRLYVLPAANSALATAGSGDVLSGIIIGLAAQGAPLEQSAVLGCYLHSRSGRLAADDLSQYSVVAGDLIRYLPRAILELMQNE